MKKSIAALSGSFLFIVLFAACSKSSNSAAPPTTGTTGTTTAYVNGTPVTTVPPASAPKIKYQLKAVNTSAGLKTTAGGTIQWTSALANPTMIKFEANKDAAEIEYRTASAGQVDLMSPTAVYFGSFILPAGTYSEVELKIYLDKSTTASLQLQGQFSHSSVTIPVSVSINESLELKTEQNDVTLTDNSSFTSLTTFDLSGLTEGITESMITGGTLTSGVLVISASSNASLYNIIIDNFRNRKHHSEVDKD